MGLLTDLVAKWELWRPGKTYDLVGRDLPLMPPPAQPVALDEPLPQIVIAAPVKDAAAHLPRWFEVIDALDYPRDRLHLRLLEGDSTDETFKLAEAGLRDRDGDYASTGLLKRDLGNRLTREERHRVSAQRLRRAIIAECRNGLLDEAMRTSADHVLFLDSDMVTVPADALRRVLAWDVPVLVGNCRNRGGGAYDLNSFVYTHPVTDGMARRFGRDALYQPPAGFCRHYPGLDDPMPLRPVHSVGGTFLLIRREVIEAGVRFPTEPYRMHIETEGFALMAAARGFGCFMDTRLDVRHV